MPIEPTPLARRQVLQAALGAGALLLGGPHALGASPRDSALAAGVCTLTPEQEEGPFYVALERIRSDIAGTRKGVPLRLAIGVIDSSTCRPLKGAAVDIWQADATGHYSDESQQGTSGQTWLRGVLLTDASGLATFTTIYPGFYAGRAPHIHVKVHIGGTRAAPYSEDTNTRTYRNADRVYTDQGGSASVLRITGGSLSSRLVGRITLAVDTGKSY